MDNSSHSCAIGISFSGAVKHWLEMHDAVDADDPLFTGVETLRASAGSDRGSTHAVTVNDLVEEWHGDADAFRLVDVE